MRPGTLSTIQAAVVTLMVMAAAIAAVIAFVAWRQRRSSAGSALVIMMLGTWVWSAGNAMEIASAGLEDKIFWANVQYVGIVGSVGAWLFVALLYSRFQTLAGKRLIVLLAVEPVIVLAAVWTNPWHGMFRRQVVLQGDGPFPTLDPAYGPLFWGHVVYTYCLLAVGTVLLVRASFYGERPYRLQSIALLIAAFVPWTGNVLFLSGITPFDLTPIAFAVSGLSLLWAMARQRLLDLAPIARAAVIDSLSDAVFVLDAKRRVVDANPAARALSRSDIGSVVGQPLEAVLPVLLAGQIEAPTGSTGQSEVTLSGQVHADGSDEDIREVHYEVRTSRLDDRFGRMIGQTLLIRDQSDRKRTEERLRRSEESYRNLFDDAHDLIQSVNGEGRFLYLNRSWQVVLGYTADELRDKHFEDILHPDERAHWRHLFDQLRQGRRLTAVETVFVSKDGSKIIVEGNIVPYYPGSGGFESRGMFRNITRRKRLEQEREQYAQQLEGTVLDRTAELLAAQEQLLEQQLLDRDLELAMEVQLSLLPANLPSAEGFQIAAAAVPARYVSGDMYDVVVEQDAWHVVLADISGKGVSAALLSSMTRVLIRNELSEHSAPLVTAANVNEALYDDLQRSERFIACLVSRLDLRYGEFTYASAGHPETFWWRAHKERCVQLPATGLPLGVSREADYRQNCHPIRPGDALIICSDGILDAEDLNGERFGIRRMRGTIAEHAISSASQLANCIIQAVGSFRGATQVTDDMTVVVIRAGPRTVHFELPAELTRLHDVTSLVRRATSAFGDEFAAELELATSEIVTNIIRHAYADRLGTIRGALWLSPFAVRLSLYDHGRAFDPTALPEPHLGQMREGGYGLHVARQVTDTLQYVPDTASGNRWVLGKHVTDRRRRSHDSG